MKKACLGMLLGLSIILAGCGSSHDSTASESPAYDKGFTNGISSDMAAAESYATDDIYEDYEESVAEEEMTDVESAGGSGGKTDLSQSVASNRKLIKNVNLSVETQEFEALCTRIESKVEKLGGYIEDCQINGNNLYSNYNRRNASYTVRVPVAKLGDMVTEVTEHSNVTNKNESAKDITLAYVDTKSHKEALEVEQERLMALLEQADTVDSIIALESRLTNVRYELQGLESQLRTYDNLVDFSTVYIDVSEVIEYTPEVVEPVSDWERLTQGFADSVKDVVKGLKNFFIGLVIALPYLLVWAVVIVIIVLIVKAIIKGAVKKHTNCKEKVQQKLEQAKSQMGENVSAESEKKEASEDAGNQ